ncbi:MAG: 4'-phosphopantetheinyl transferase superfamily protein [Acidobacteriota bacterium]|nr:4'-phosphopantetheinyl transferase superfamily protein [Acidobacteriota bacterium]
MGSGARRPGGPPIAIRQLQVPDGAPSAWLLDATACERGEPGLRDAARAVCAQSGAAHCSRSYAYPLALAACHEGPVGVDLERVVPCDDRFLESISTPDERAAGVGEGDRDRRITSLWSSKEALAKALGDALAYDPRRLGSPMLWPEGSSGPWRACPLDAAPGHVAWLCWRAGDP